MQFWNEQALSFNLVYSSTCYPAGMGTSKIRLLFATLLQHYVGSNCLQKAIGLRTRFNWIDQSDFGKDLNRLLVMLAESYIRIMSTAFHPVSREIYGQY